MFPTGKIFQRFQVRIDQRVPKILKSWFDGRSKIPVKKYFFVIGKIIKKRTSQF